MMKHKLNSRRRMQATMRVLTSATISPVEAPQAIVLPSLPLEIMRSESSLHQATERIPFS